MGQKVGKAVAAVNKQTGTCRNTRDRDQERIIIDGLALSCPVCYNVFHKCPLVLKCGHSFCKECLKSLSRHAPFQDYAGRKLIECPICRNAMRTTLGEIPNNFVLEAVLDSIKEVGEDDSIPTLDRNLKFENVRLRKQILEAQATASQTKKEADQTRDHLRLWKVAAIGLGIWFLYRCIWAWFLEA